jgi:hypothetical protein
VRAIIISKNSVGKLERKKQLRIWRVQGMIKISRVQGHRSGAFGLDLSGSG